MYCFAEGIAGTEEEFAIMMTEKAREIGMENTNFSNSSGINAPDNLSTVRDILIMSNYLIKNYPNYYEYYKKLNLHGKELVEILLNKVIVILCFIKILVLME